MGFIIRVSLLLFCSVYPVSSIDIPPIQPCTNLGETRIYTTSENTTFPQICTQYTASASSTLSSGPYFFSMCYNGGWSNPQQSDDFCYLSGYIDTTTRATYTNLFDITNPKFSNLNCMGDPSEISLCGGTLTTASCGYVTGLTCVECSTGHDCLGDDNSICNGICSCKECVNGVCYVGGCLCSDGYEGEICDRRICTPACQNSGECQENNTCECSFPHSGNRCEMNITCNPSCPENSECIVDVEVGTVFCCYGEVDGNTCITATTATTATIPPLLTTPTNTITATLPPVVVSSSLGTSEIILLSFLTVGVLCCLVVGLSCLTITLCVVIIMMKGKMSKDNKSQQFDMSGYIEERRPTIYAAVDEKEMLDYEENPVPPPTRDPSNYVEMDPAKVPERKTSHYEIEDDILEAKTSLSKIANEANEMFTIREENTVLDEPNFLEYPPQVMLLRNDSDWSENEHKYENQNILQDHQ